MGGNLNGSDFGPPLCIGLSFAFLRVSGNWPFMKLINVIFNRVEATTSVDFFRISGVRPSSPVACNRVCQFYEWNAKF